MPSSAQSLLNRSVNIEIIGESGSFRPQVGTFAAIIHRSYRSIQTIFAAVPFLLAHGVAR